MNRFSRKVSNFHSDLLMNTKLGQLCGSKTLFRERYAILRILGRGGFGVTFLARNVTLPGNPLCVIKQLCPKVSSPKSWAKAKERFEKEAKTLGQLGNHSQIPMLLDYFEVGGEFFLVQEYVRGCTLTREVRRSGVLSEDAVKKFLQEILPVLQYIHKNHVIHRDIKPQNLLRCDDDGRLVLIDFGAVREELAKASELADKTATTNFVGTMGFAPPEQFSLRPVYSSDIYALGVTSLYLLSGKAPLEFDYDTNTGEICWQKQLTVSEHFGSILNKMLKVSVKERFSSASEVMFALGIESHLPHLNNCLSIQPLKEKKKPTKTNSFEDNYYSYVPPFTRTAIAIREWKAKINARKSRRSYKHYSSMA
ncbi:serine/threonine protein kinase [Rivularia sp. PCC 7116]|uniref:serine/threonine-protein kinase n=1 Tax=Rivularia sp. PCC 7116 TaxID=373994 RepID=UPI00029F1974|nr:serine/threonine-protein kinase [Rivularia sp. PCC 7116]AFY57805.1 serine/threonine protein kinase [Rivularia sp. PCC 7116]